MSDQNDEQRAQVRLQQQRQYEIDRITAQYADAFRRGKAPHIEDYIRRHPNYARELLEFALYFHTLGFDAAEPDEFAASGLLPGAQKALAQIRRRRMTASTGQLEGLVKHGAVVGYSAQRLAEAVGLTTELLGRLEARAISVTTIPPTLVRRLADTLQVAPEAVAAYLGASRPGQAGAFYYSDQPPTQQQESFLDAVQASALSLERKQEWTTIVRTDAGRTGE